MEIPSKEWSIPLFKLENPIRNYAWGSYDGMSLYAGIKTDGDRPAAEYWMGAHSASPSLAVFSEGSKLSLRKFIEEYPIGSLGEEAFYEFGELPFLFKVLSASMPLSLQVHPGKEKAETGFGGEIKNNGKKPAHERLYSDKNHKPELAVALSPFSALCGFREAAAAAELLGRELCGFTGFDATTPEASFRNLLAKILPLRDKEKTFLELKATARAKELAESGENEARKAGEATLLCFRHYPHDPGALAPLFMGLYFLQPGEGLYVPSGVMHSYLIGTIFEVMAASDNVIRGGLTHKHIDVAELLDVLDFAARPQVVLPRQTAAAPQESFWPVPEREFSLSRLSVEGRYETSPEPWGPQILHCTEGSLSIAAMSVFAEAPRGQGAEKPEKAQLEMRKGETVFVGAACKGYRLEGRGIVFRAGLGTAAETAAQAPGAGGDTK